MFLTALIILLFHIDKDESETGSRYGPVKSMERTVVNKRSLLVLKCVCRRWRTYDKADDRQNGTDEQKR